jgi:hypothetical protein
MRCPLVPSFAITVMGRTANTLSGIVVLCELIVLARACLMKEATAAEELDSGRLLSLGFSRTGHCCRAPLDAGGF